MKKVAFILPLLLSACATNYVAPTGEDTASLVLPVKTSSWRFLGGASSSKVSFAVKGNDGCGRIFKQIQPEDKEDDFVEVTIPGNEDIFVVFSSNSGNDSCTISGEFHAITGNTYKVEKIGGGFACALRVEEISEGGEARYLALKRAATGSFSGTTVCAR